MSLKNLQSKEELASKLVPGNLVVLHFWASWCEPSKAMDIVLAQLAEDTPHAQFFRVEAEEQPEISEDYEVAAVPFFVFLKDGVVVDKLQGANAPELANKVAKWATINAAAAPASVGFAAGLTTVPEAVTKQLWAPPVSNGKTQHQSSSIRQTETQSQTAQKPDFPKLINQSPIMLFMKGTPENPSCGFSRKVVDALNAEGVTFGSFDILSDEAVRQGLKEFSNWPTFPQLYVRGELLGGCDIVTEMHESGELKEVFKEKGLLHGEDDSKHSTIVEPAISEDLKASSAFVPAGTPGIATTNGGAGGGHGNDTSDSKARFEQLVNEHPIMLFMKGSPTDPRCGFSRKVVDTLGELGVDYGTFDILNDDTVRQGLKDYSNWTTYPQLYIKGEFIGGCDIVLEMHQSGELKQVLLEKGLLPAENIDQRLKKLIHSSQTMLFMKGTPDEPRCGFSNKVVSALREEGVEFGSFDILTDEEVRQGLKTYSNWPTYPQLYHKGELLGGCDIVLEMKDSGDLRSTLES